jgi:transposase
MGKRPQRYSIIAGLCNHEVIAPYIYQGYMNGTSFLDWLENELCPLLKEGQVVILDNAKFHHVTEESGRNVASILNKVNCRAIFLPPYSPELNKIERVWGWIKMELKKMNDLVDTLSNKILKTIENINSRWKEVLRKKSLYVV